MMVATSPSDDVIRGFGPQSWTSHYPRSVVWMKVAVCQDQKGHSTLVSMNTGKENIGKKLRKMHNKTSTFTCHKLLLEDKDST